jgi:hypothetical protein
MSIDEEKHSFIIESYLQTCSRQQTFGALYREFTEIVRRRRLKVRGGNKRNRVRGELSTAHPHEHSAFQPTKETD